MAASPLDQARRSSKIVKYGKRPNRSAYDTLVEDDKHDIASPLSRVREANVKRTFAINKPYSNSRTVSKTQNGCVRTIDPFDVPSSDEESATPKLSTPTVLRLNSMAKAASDSPLQRLAPWEERGIGTTISNPLRRLHVAGQLSPTKITPRQDAEPGAQKSSDTVERRVINRSHVAENGVLDNGAGGDTTSAAERLAMRRKIHSGQRIAAQTVLAPSNTPLTSHTSTSALYARKRQKLDIAKPFLAAEPQMFKSDETHESDVEMSDHRPNGGYGEHHDEQDRLDTTSSESVVNGTGQGRKSRNVPLDAPRPPRQEVSGADNTPVAHNNQSQTLADVDLIFNSNIDGIKSTPKLRKPGLSISTPKQERLWDDILTGTSITRPGYRSKEQTNRSTLAAPPRTRLVDRLKASAESSDDEDEKMPVCQDKGQQVTTSSHTVTGLPTPQIATDRPVPTVLEPKITYAKQRSYLQEDTLEDSILFDIPMETGANGPSSSRRTARRGQRREASAYDIEDSSDDEGPARLRTIHELRAAGQSISFMQDTEAIFEDISNHNKSGVSRRRSAMMELAGKLTDQTFVARFFSQEFEEKLLAELEAASDEVTDFVMATVLALLMSTEASQQAVRFFADGRILPWLVNRVGRELDIEQAAKDRRNNLSQSARASLMDEFVPMVLAQQTLWHPTAPSSLSLRMITLKCLERYVMHIRKKGSREELLKSGDLAAVVGGRPLTKDDPAIVETVVSLLESLSTSAVTLNWSADVLDRLAQALPELASMPNLSTQTTFLMLRLTLNLTNDNAQNCEHTATPAVVHYLMRTVCGGFCKLESNELHEESVVTLDFLVLALGVMINLAEQCDRMRVLMIEQKSAASMSSLLSIFTRHQERAQEAESMEQSTTNVAFGYLAVMLANVCVNDRVRQFVAAQLHGASLQPLVDAVAEFVMHHERVDRLEFDGDEGRGVWSAFTARLQAVLERLRSVLES